MGNVKFVEAFFSSFALLVDGILQMHSFWIYATPNHSSCLHILKTELRLKKVT